MRDYQEKEFNDLSKKSATDQIKKLNPKNVSGTIPQALDLIKQLKNVGPGQNPKMPDAVGQQNLMGMLSFISQLFNQNKKQQQDDESNKQNNCQIYMDLYNQTANTDYLDEYTLCIATNKAANVAVSNTTSNNG